MSATRYAAQAGEWTVLVSFAATTDNYFDVGVGLTAEEAADLAGQLAAAARKLRARRATAEQCRFCLRPATGDPFCCPERQRFVLKLAAGEHEVVHVSAAADPDPAVCGLRFGDGRELCGLATGHAGPCGRETRRGEGQR